MKPFVALDVTRLALSPLTATPRGIDRVEYAYARHFLENWSGDCFPVLPTLWGLRWFDRHRGLGGLRFVDAWWKESGTVADDPAFGSMKQRLQGKALAPLDRRLSAVEVASGFARLLSRTGFDPGRSVPRRLPVGSVYLSVGHTGVIWRPLVSWLERRSDVRGVFMVHDAIPLEHPGLFTEHQIERHRRLLSNTARFARALITPSKAAAASVATVLSELGRTSIPTLAEPLPLPTVFERREPIDPDLAVIPYFVACGAFEARKNYMFLLRLWSRLVRQQGHDAPRLVIAGDIPSEGSPERAFLRANVALRSHVVDAAGLSTPALRQLLQSSRGLLMPSLAEGFGLPIIEALALGRPVVASSLPAHKEAGGSAALYLDPSDEDAWMAAIMALAPRAANGEPEPSSAAFRATTTKVYFEKVEAFLESLE